jgi:hypothetical protein
LDLETHNQNKEKTSPSPPIGHVLAKKFTKASLANIGSQIETGITQQYCMPVKPLII